jgi:hypothetical protein
MTGEGCSTGFAALALAPDSRAASCKDQALLAEVIWSAVSCLNSVREWPNTDWLVALYPAAT